MSNPSNAVDVVANDKGCGQGIRILNLDTLRPLFCNDQAYQEFIAVLMEKCVHNRVLITSGDTVIAAMQSTLDAREAFQWKIAARLAEEPNLLKTLKERAEDGRFIEYGTFDVPNDC